MGAQVRPPLPMGGHWRRVCLLSRLQIAGYRRITECAANAHHCEL